MITNLKVNGTNYPIMKGVYGICSRNGKGNAGNTVEATFLRATGSASSWFVYYTYVITNTGTLRVYGSSDYGVRIVGGPANGYVVYKIVDNYNDTYTYHFELNENGASPYYKGTAFSLIYRFYNSATMTVCANGTQSSYYLDLISSDQATELIVESLNDLHTAIPVKFNDGVNTCKAADNTAEFRKKQPSLQLRYTKPDGTIDYKSFNFYGYSLVEQAYAYLILDGDNAFITGGDNYVYNQRPADAVTPTVTDLNAAGYYPPFLISTHVIATTTSSATSGSAVLDCSSEVSKYVTCNLNTNYTFNTSRVQYYPLAIIGGRGKSPKYCLDDLFIGSRSYNTCQVGCHVTNHASSTMGGYSEGTPAVTCQILWQREIK